MANSKPRNKNFDGVQSAAEMLNLLDKPNREKLLDDVEKMDPEVAKKIRQKMFVFEDLARIEARGIQVLLKEVPQKKLALALRNAPDELREVIFKNMSSRSAQILKEDIDNQGPQKLSDVTAAQKEMIVITKRLLAQGIIRITE